MAGMRLYRQCWYMQKQFELLKPTAVDGAHLLSRTEKTERQEPHRDDDPSILEDPPRRCRVDDLPSVWSRLEKDIALDCHVEHENKLNNAQRQGRDNKHEEYDSVFCEARFRDVGIVQ